jgi:hypothetical protein
MTFFHYVPHDKIEAFIAQGWVIVSRLENTPHGFYAVFMKWEGQGEPS